MINFKKPLVIKVSFVLIILIQVIKQIIILFDTFVEYVEILELLSQRLLVIVFILLVVGRLSDVPFVKDFRKEMEKFGEGPKNKSLLLTKIRDWHFMILLAGYLSYFIGISYTENLLVTNLMCLVSITCFGLYLVHFVVYSKAYIRRSFIYNKKNVNINKGPIRNIFTGAFVKKTGTLCVECLKVTGAAVLSGEVLWKFSSGSMNAVSPPRNWILNKEFPDDKTKIWTETKAALAYHQKSMGIPHGTMYEPVGEKMKKSLLGGLEGFAGPKQK